MNNTTTTHRFGRIARLENAGATNLHKARFLPPPLGGSGYLEGKVYRAKNAKDAKDKEHRTLGVLGDLGANYSATDPGGSRPVKAAQGCTRPHKAAQGRTRPHKAGKILPLSS